MDKHLVKRFAILGIFLVVLFGGIFGWRAFVAAKTDEAMAQAARQRTSVSVAAVERIDWPAQLEATASLQAVQGATLTPQLAGMVTGIHFRSGETVKQGELLVQLNDATQRAQLVRDESALKLAKTKLDQQRALYRRHSTSELALQEADTAYTQARAAVSSGRATIAKLQVRAPFTGHLGLRQVSLGQYLDTTTPVVDLQQWNPIYAVFQVPQQQLARLQTGQKVSLSVAGIDGRSFDGTLTAIGAKVQPGTRNVQVQATFPNADDTLRPGMYGEVTVQTGESHQVLAVPDSAITYNTYGSYVYVVEQGKNGPVVQQRNVQTGESRGGETVVSRGVQAGERVVTAGQVKLRPGAAVTVAPAVSAAVPAGAGS